MRSGGEVLTNFNLLFLTLSNATPNLLPWKHFPSKMHQIRLEMGPHFRRSSPQVPRISQAIPLIQTKEPTPALPRCLTLHPRPSSYLQDKVVCDVGCANGYYMFRMLESDPKMVVGIDPNLSAWLQFEAVKRLALPSTPAAGRLHYEFLRGENIDCFPRMCDFAGLLPRNSHSVPSSPST